MLFAGILVVDLVISRQDQFEEMMVCVCVIWKQRERERDGIFAFCELFKNKNDSGKKIVYSLFIFYFCIMNY